MHNSQISPLQERFCENPKCSIRFNVKRYDPKKYCNSSCSATITNTYRERVNKFCLYCNIRLKRRISIYCSLSCQQTFRYKTYIDSWKNGLKDGNIGKTVVAISHHLRRYLLEKFGKKCSICGWSEKNPVTGVVPLEIDHIDGNHKNNQEENLRIICPNCHALTPTFKNLNKGKGRSWRLKLSHHAIV